MIVSILLTCDKRMIMISLEREKAILMIPKVEASRPGVRLLHLNFNPDVQCVMYVNDEAKAVADLCYLPEEVGQLPTIPIAKVKADYGHEIEMTDKPTGESISLRYFYFVEFLGGEIYYTELKPRFERVGPEKIEDLGVVNLPLDMFKPLTS